MCSLNYYHRLKFQQLLALISYCTEFSFLFPTHPEFSDSSTSWKHHKFLSGTTQILVRCSTANSLKILLVSILLILESLEKIYYLVFKKEKQTIYFIHFKATCYYVTRMLKSAISISGISAIRHIPGCHRTKVASMTV